MGTEKDNKIDKNILEANIKLVDENKQLQQQCKKQKEVIDKAIEYINENWGHWCSNHCKYATETINILKGSDKE